MACFHFGAQGNFNLNTLQLHSAFFGEELRRLFFSSRFVFKLFLHSARCSQLECREDNNVKLKEKEKKRRKKLEKLD